MDAGISTFHVDWKLIVIQLVNFGIVFFVLYRYALQPLATLMNDRKKTIAQGVTDAATNAVLVEKAAAIFEEEKIKAQEQAQKLLVTMKNDIEQQRTQMLADSHAQAEKILTDTRLQLEQEKTALIAEARTAIGELVVQSTRKVLEQVPSDIAQTLMAQSIHDL